MPEPLDVRSGHRSDTRATRHVGVPTNSGNVTITAVPGGGSGSVVPPASGRDELPRPIPVVRIGATMTADESACARYLRAKARVTERPERRRRRYEPMDSFVLDPVLEILDDLESGRLSRSEIAHVANTRMSKFGPGERAWVRNAVTRYPDLGAEGLRPVPGYWAVQAKSDWEIRELYSWGRGYLGDGGLLRVFVFLSFSRAQRSRAGEPKTAVAAMTTALGRLCPRPSPWSKPFTPEEAPDVVPERVSIRQVGLLDGSMVELFAGTPDEAKALYEKFGRMAAGRAAAGADPTPGRDCANCPLIDTCDAVLPTPGLMGLAMPDAPLRSVSATTLRYHAACPRQARLNSMHLSHDAQEPSFIRVGRLVDGLLNDAHGAGRGTPCSDKDLQASLASTPSADPADRTRAAVLLSHHVEVCPLRGCEITDVQEQAQVVSLDPEASVVVVARPDVIYRDDGDLVWRETTTSFVPPRSSKHLFDTSKGIQVALAVLLCHAGALGEPVKRIEVEYLTDHGADLRYLDPTDTALVRAARAVVEPIVAHWRNDEEFPAVPGDPCSSCAYLQWCPDAVAPEGKNDA